MKAYCLIRSDPVYRREAFCNGLANAGYSVQGCRGWFDAGPGRPGDVLVMWNRYGEWHQLATRFEKEGGDVIVAENAYVALDRANRQRYAIARDGHNGSGCWHVGGPERWQALGIELQPWREQGEHILVLPNRSFGRPDMIMPTSWAEDVAAKLRKYTTRPVRVRPHPGNNPPKKALADDLRDAWAAVVWTSSAGCEALIAGIPVYCTGPYWVAGLASCKDLRTIDNPTLPDRLPAMQRLAWAQWHIEEIQRGEPFQYLRDKPCTFPGSV